MWHRPHRLPIRLRSETRPEPTSRWCGAEASGGASEQDSSAARSSAERSPRPTIILGTHIGTRIMAPTTRPIMAPTTDPTPDTDIRTKGLAEGTGTTDSSVVAIDLAYRGARAPYVVEVNPAVPAKTVPEFIAYAKLN